MVFVDPPYNNRHGNQYIHKADDLNFDLLDWLIVTSANTILLVVDRSSIHSNERRLSGFQGWRVVQVLALR